MDSDTREVLSAALGRVIAQGLVIEVLLARVLSEMAEEDRGTITTVLRQTSANPRHKEPVSDAAAVFLSDAATSSRAAMEAMLARVEALLAAGSQRQP